MTVENSLALLLNLLLPALLGPLHPLQDSVGPGLGTLYLGADVLMEGGEYTRERNSCHVHLYL